MGVLQFLKRTAASVLVTDVDHIAIFDDVADDVVKTKNFAGTVAPIGNPLSTSAPPIITTSATSVIGVTSRAAREDHDHGLTVATVNTILVPIRPQYNAVADFGFVGDLVTVFDGACDVGAAPTKITSLTAAWVAGDVGKRITLSGAGVASAQYVGTITAVDSAIQVTISPNISTTGTARGLSFGTDNTAAITAMTTLVNVTNATFPGVKIVFPQSTTNAYGFPTRVVFNKPVQIEGIGGGHTADTGDYTRIGGTRLAWWGTTFDGGVDFAAFFDVVPTGVQSLKRVAFRHCWLDCRNGDQNQALIGLQLLSCHAFMLEDFFIVDALAMGLVLGIGTTPTEAKDTTRFSIKDFCSRQLDNPAGAVTAPFLMTSAVILTQTPQALTVAANTLPTAGYLWTQTTQGGPVLVKYTGGGGSVTLTGCTISLQMVVHTPTTVAGGNIVQAVPGNGSCITLNGGSAANTCCGVLQMVQCSHGTTWGPAAVESWNSDSVDWYKLVCNGGINTNDGAINRIRKPGIRLNGSIVSAALSSRNFTLRSSSAGAGGLSVMGVNNAGVRLLAMATPHYVELYELGNGEPVPVVEGSSYLQWDPSGGVSIGKANASIADQAIAAATLTQFTGSLIAIPPQGFQIGTTFRWTICCSKTAAGAAARTITIRIGTLGTIADAVVATFVSTAGTAAVDVAYINVILTVRTLGAAATATAQQTLMHHQAITGFALVASNVITGTMATFNSTTAQQFISVAMTTGAAEVLTVQLCTAEVVVPSNP